MPEWGRVKNGKPRLAKSDRIPLGAKDTFVIGTAMAHRHYGIM
jgi:hypothetical protein